MMIAAAIGLLVAAAGDACASLADEALIAQLNRAHPGYRWPKATDSDEHDVKYSLQHDGPACLRVASGDFDADGIKDRAVLLTPTAPTGGALLVAALRRKAEWELATLRRFDAGYVSRLYVVAGKPGHYQHFEGLATVPSEPGEVAAVRATAHVVVTGVSESSAIVYARTNHSWVHVWTSD